MAAWRRTGGIEIFHDKIIDGMLANGYTREFAEQCFSQIEGLANMASPKAMPPASPCWCMPRPGSNAITRPPSAAALLNSQPMGFYAPAQIVRDAREHGVEMRPVDVNFSHWDCTLEEAPRAAQRQDSFAPKGGDPAAARRRGAEGKS